MLPLPASPLKTGDFPYWDLWASETGSYVYALVSGLRAEKYVLVCRHCASATGTVFCTPRLKSRNVITYIRILVTVRASIASSSFPLLASTLQNMATIPPKPIGTTQDTKASIAHGGLKVDAGSEHVEHIERIETAVPAGQSTNTTKTEQFKDIETVAYVVEEVHADFKLVPVILDEVRPDEVLVEMKYSGICSFGRDTDKLEERKKG